MYFPDEARGIEIVAPFAPTTIEAGEPFNLTFNILDKTGSVLTNGTDSVLFGELQIAWENDTKLIYDRINREDIQFKEMVNISIIQINFGFILTR